MPFCSLPCPVDLFRLHAAQPDRYPFLLQTSGGTPGWDILFAFPERQISQRLGQPGSFFEQLDAAWRAENSAHDPDNKASWLPFHGGWFVYLGYELLHEIEASVPSRGVRSEFPVGFAARVPAAIMVDHEHETTYLYTEPAHAALLDVIKRDIAHSPPYTATEIACHALGEETPEQYLQG